MNVSPNFSLIGDIPVFFQMFLVGFTLEVWTLDDDVDLWVLMSCDLNVNEM